MDDRDGFMLKLFLSLHTSCVLFISFFLLHPCCTGMLSRQPCKFPCLVLGLCPCSARIDGRCDFESSLCGYSQFTTDNIDWIVGRGIAAISPTAPQYDHTTMSAQGKFAEGSFLW